MERQLFVLNSENFLIFSDCLLILNTKSHNISEISVKITIIFKKTFYKKSI